MFELQDAIKKKQVPPIKFNFINILLNPIFHKSNILQRVFEKKGGIFIENSNPELMMKKPRKVTFEK